MEEKVKVNYDLDSFFYLSRDLMCILDDETGFIKVNPALEALLEYPAGELEDISILQYIHEKDRTPSHNYLKSIKEQAGEEKKHKSRFITRTGQERWVEWRSVSFREDHFYLIAHEVTEEKRLEKEVKYDKEKINQIINLVPHPIFLKSPAGKYLMVNQAQADLFASSKEVMIGKTDQQLISNKIQTRLIRDTDQEVLLEKEEVILPEQNLSISEDKKAILKTHKIPFENIDGKTLILGVSFDLTDIKKTENELKKANFELDSFVYRTSHDLRAPLCSMRGLVNLILHEKTAAGRRTCVDQALKSIQRLDNFIADLTHYSRNSRLEPEMTQINFGKLIRQTYKHLQFMEGADKLDLKVSIEQDAAFESDLERMRIIFLNLMSNAIKYRKTKGTTTSRLKISINADDKGASISFKDNGLGIKKSLQPKIFDMFFRGEEEIFGSGLGLYIVNQVVNKLQGNIKLLSKRDKGTEFRIFLPKYSSPE